MGHFKVKSKRRLSELPIGETIPESDFATLTPDGLFVQLEYVEEQEEAKTYIVKPGTWSLQRTAIGLALDHTSFVKDEVLDDFIHTKTITDKIDCFFNRLHVYREHGIEVPSRKMLLFGVPGTGKTTAAIHATRKYSADGKTAVLVWGTDKIDPYEVKDFIRTFEYKGVEKLIVIMEDIGGVEVDQVRMKSTASLLSLLDNQEKTFKIPHFVLATTNHPENFLGSLTNRPGRFDDKVKVDYPPAAQRAKLLRFFMKSTPDEATLERIQHKKYTEFSPAHIKEIVIRSAIYDVTISDAMESIWKEIEQYKNMFQEKQKLGIAPSNDFDD